MRLQNKICVKKNPTYNFYSTKIIKPQTLGPMLSFLGMAGCRRLWICDYVEKWIHATGQSDNSTWADVVELSFQLLKHNLQTTPEVKSPN